MAAKKVEAAKTAADLIDIIHQIGILKTSMGKTLDVEVVKLRVNTLINTRTEADDKDCENVPRIYNLRKQAMNIKRGLLNSKEKTEVPEEIENLSSRSCPAMGK